VGLLSYGATATGKIKIRVLLEEQFGCIFCDWLKVKFCDCHGHLRGVKFSLAGIPIGLDFSEYAAAGRLGRNQPYWKAAGEYSLNPQEVNKKIRCQELDAQL
jgi:hypothetical protein